MSKIAVVTGASRGIGLEFAKQFSADGWTVIGACRNPVSADELAGINGVEVHQLDVDHGESVQAMKVALGCRPIDVLINNAGIPSHTEGGIENM